jgi:GMP synthase-like glutamine amidotransferase
LIRFLAIQHTFSEFLGTFEHQLESRGIGFVYQRPMAGQDLAGSALQFDALWLLGGAYTPDDREHCPWLDDELRLIQVFRAAGRPVVGLGFGAQLLALSFGGGVSGAQWDARWTVARKTAAGQGDPLAEALDGRPVLVLAAGAVELAPAIEPLLVDPDGRWLAIRPSPASYGLLFRPELKPGMIEDMIMEEGRPLPNHIDALLEETRVHWHELQQVSDLTAAALVSALDLMRERRKMPVFSLHLVPKD